MKNPSTTQPAELPSVYDDPDYVQARAKLNEIQKRRSKLSAALDAAVADLSSRSALSGVEAAAEAVLAGEEAPSAELAGAREKVQKMQRDDEVLKRAEEKARAAMTCKSRDIAAKLRPEYKPFHDSIGRDFALLILAAMVKADHSRDFEAKSRIRLAGNRLGFEPLTRPVFRFSLRNTHNFGASYLRDAYRAGWLEAKEIIDAVDAVNGPEQVKSYITGGAHKSVAAK